MWIPFILFLLWLLWLKLPTLCWILVVRVGTLVLFLTSEEMLSVFHHWGWCMLWFIIDGFYFVEICSFYACFLESFNHKWVLNFVKGFLCIYWNNHMVLILQFINVVYHIDWFANIEEFCIPGIKPTWSWSFQCYWILFAEILLRIFASMFISDIGL